MISTFFITNMKYGLIIWSLVGPFAATAPSLRDSGGGYRRLPVAVPLAVPPTGHGSLSPLTGPAANPARLMQLGNIGHVMCCSTTGLKVRRTLSNGIKHVAPVTVL